MKSNPYKFRTSMGDTYQWSDWAGGAFLNHIDALMEKHPEVDRVTVDWNSGSGTIKRLQVERKSEEQLERENKWRS